MKQASAVLVYHCSSIDWSVCSDISLSPEETVQFDQPSPTCRLRIWTAGKATCQCRPNSGGGQDAISAWTISSDGSAEESRQAWKLIEHPTCCTPGWLFCGWFSSASCSLCSQSAALSQDNTLAGNIQNQFVCKPGLRNLKEDVCSERPSALVYFINYLKFI